MMGTVSRRDDLVESVATHCKVSKELVNEVIKNYTDYIESSVIVGEYVRVLGLIEFLPHGMARTGEFETLAYQAHVISEWIPGCSPVVAQGILERLRWEILGKLGKGETVSLWSIARLSGSNKPGGTRAGYNYVGLPVRMQKIKGAW